MFPRGFLQTPCLGVFLFQAFRKPRRQPPCCLTFVVFVEGSSKRQYTSLLCIFCCAGFPFCFWDSFRTLVDANQKKRVVWSILGEGKQKGAPKPTKSRILVGRRCLKKRSQVGWRGLISDPALNGQEDLARGLALGRRVLPLGSHRRRVQLVGQNETTGPQV